MGKTEARTWNTAQHSDVSGAFDWRKSIGYGGCAEFGWGELGEEGEDGLEGSAGHGAAKGEGCYTWAEAYVRGGGGVGEGEEVVGVEGAGCEVDGEVGRDGVEAAGGDDDGAGFGGEVVELFDDILQPRRLPRRIYVMNPMLRARPNQLSPILPERPHRTNHHLHSRLSLSAPQPERPLKVAHIRHIHLNEWYLPRQRQRLCHRRLKFTHRACSETERKGELGRGVVVG